MDPADTSLQKPRAVRRRSENDQKFERFAHPDRTKSPKAQARVAEIEQNAILSLAAVTGQKSGQAAIESGHIESLEAALFVWTHVRLHTLTSRSFLQFAMQHKRCSKRGTTPLFTEL